MKKKPYTPLPPDQDPKVLGIFTKDKTFYKTFFPLLLIIAAQQLTALGVNLADNIMLGRYTEMALSGATLVNQLQFVLLQTTAGVGMGIVVLASQYWGKQQIEPIKRIIALGSKFGLLIGAVFFIVTILCPSTVLGLFTNDTAVIAEGVEYLKIICWTYLLFAISNSLMYSLQSVETAFIGMVMSLSTICINICLNYFLIYGNGGAPELGIRGAAFATLTSRMVELIIILVYILKIDKKLKMKVKDLLRTDFSYLKDYFKVCLPITVSGALWGVAQAAQTAILGHISATTIAANSIAIVIFQLFAVLGMSCTNASSVVTGKTIGEGKLHMVRSYSKTLQGLYILIGLFCAALIFIFREPIISIYAVSEETKTLAMNFLLILGFTTIGTCYEYPVEAGIIGGGGHTKYTAIVDNLFMWLFTIPAAFLSAFIFQFPPEVTFFFLKVDQFLKCIPNAIVCNRFRWVRILTKPEQPAA